MRKLHIDQAIEVTNIPYIEPDVHPTVTMLEGNEVIEYVNEKYFNVTQYKIQNEIHINNPFYSLCLPLSGMESYILMEKIMIFKQALALSLQVI